MQDKILNKHKRLQILLLLFLLTATFVSFLPSLKNDFVEWDDPQYIIENNVIRSLKPANIKEIFTSFYVANYQPLSMLTYSFEYSLFKLNPVAYHTTNLILHLLNCLLVFWLIFKLTNTNFTAFFTALFFGIHPMHVESVAWVSQRKDVLYAFFFLLALVSYLHYLKSGYPRKYYYLCLVLFVLSCLSKSMAVALPLLLLAFDYQAARKADRDSLIEKIPFIALAAVFIVIAFLSQHSGGAIRYKHLFSFIQSGYVLICALTFYLVKIMTPLKLSCIYPYPNVSVEHLPRIFLLSPLVIGTVVAAVIYSGRYTRKVIFGSAFFLFAIFPVLQLVPFGNILAADRYTYVPSIGLFYIMAEFFLWFYKKKARYSAFLKVLFIVFLASLSGIMAFLTWRRARVWKNAIILFDDVLRRYPHSYVAYNNRGAAYLDRKEYDRATSDFNQAIKLNKDIPDAYGNLCNANILQGRYEVAIMYCKKAIILDPANEKAYYNLANAYAELGKNDKAIVTYRKAISIKKDYAEAYNNLATIYVAMEEYGEAANLFKKALEISPDFAEAYYNLAVVYARNDTFGLAVKYCDKAVELGYKPEQDLLDTLYPYRN